MGLRRKGRELAMQTLYALGFAETSDEFVEYSLLKQYPEVFHQLLTSERIDYSSPLSAFAEELIKNTIINLDDIADQITKHSANWSMESLAPLERSMLQIAVYELMFTDTPPAVVINEAIEISKKYSSEGAGKFLNGILDAVSKELKDTQDQRR
ncbi:MAG: transcription antitermination factor NusB [Candidatus Cloacimonetes bacterium]|nr:transcription antitermination factor NusB [Candidatus Cloacimonadota bacterium]NLO11413.1 transcription antitermination factor NusB [Candidatus Cloacimonadota bacterium]